MQGGGQNNLFNGGGFGFGFQSPLDTDPYTPGVQTSPYDHDPTRPGIQAAGSVNKVPHISGPGDSNPYIAGNQSGYNNNPGVQIAANFGKLQPNYGNGQNFQNNSQSGPQYNNRF